MPNSGNRRVELRGYERMATMSPALSRKIAHIMLVGGRDNDPSAINELLRYLPSAVMQTVNKHPRMRAIQCRDEFASEIYPQITLKDVNDRKLLVFQDDTDNFHEHIEKECDMPFDRYKQFPFFLHVWRAHGAAEARLVLFSDHYMSDGLSGVMILNSILEDTVELSKSGGEMKQVVESPLRPSVYEMWLSPLRFTRILGEHLVWLFSRVFYKRHIENLILLLPPRSDQANLTLPVAIKNRTRAKFANGTVDSARRILAKCKTEGTTYGAAVMAAAVIAYYYTAKMFSAKVDPKHFRLTMNVDVNLRNRIGVSTGEDLVGYYVAEVSIGSLASLEGIDLEKSRFWDSVRQIRADLVAAISNDFTMSMAPIFMDQTLNSEAGADTLGFEVPSAITGDNEISSLGRYPYAKTFSFGGSILDIDSLHFFNAMPVLAPAGEFNISSVDKFCYTMAHKYEDDVAATLFSAFVALAEHIADIGNDETMLHVADWVDNDAIICGLSCKIGPRAG